MPETAQQLAEIADLLDSASNEERDPIVDRLIEVARSDREVFVKTLRSLPLEQPWPQFWYYEAVAKDATSWEAFIMDELDRVLAVAEREKMGSGMLTTLQALGAIKDKAIRRRLASALLRWAGSPSPEVRRVVADLIGEFSEPNDIESTRVLEQLTHDTDWRTRLYARQTLNEDRGRPLNDGVGIVDWLRIRVLNPYVW